MEAVLIQQKCAQALKGKGMLSVTSGEERDGGQGQSAFVLCLGGKFLRDEEGDVSHLGNDAL